MDYRSLYLHFECGAYIIRFPRLPEFEEDMQKCLKMSQQITLDCDQRGTFSRLCGGVLRLIAPLM